MLKLLQLLLVNKIYFTMSQSTHVLFSNIFSETHAELHTLQQDLEQLQTAYLSDDHEINIDSDNTDAIPQHLVYVLIEEYESELPDEQLHKDDKANEEVFTPEQIQKFYKIYENIAMEDYNEYNDKN